MPLKIYSITGPERTYIEYIDEWVADKYPVYDWYLVEAPTKKDAAWAAWKRAKQNKDLWYTDHDTEHPLTGIKVEEFICPAPFYDDEIGQYIDVSEEWTADMDTSLWTDEDKNYIKWEK